MILIDTSVWVDHLRSGEPRLVALLDDGLVLGHPFVIGELALGNVMRRDAVLADLQDLPQAVVASDEEVLHFINRHELFALGIGYVDAHLLAAARLTGETSVWTQDKRMRNVAVHLGLAADLLD